MATSNADVEGALGAALRASEHDGGQYDIATSSSTHPFRFWDNVNTEDISICEKAQLGTGSLPYTGGRFSFRFEEPLHRFQNMVIDKVLADKPTRYRIPGGDQ